MIKACSGKELRDRRDEALIRPMVEPGARAGEVAAMGVADVDVKEGVAIVRQGKGGRAARAAPSRSARRRRWRLTGM